MGLRKYWGFGFGGSYLDWKIIFYGCLIGRTGGLEDLGGGIKGRGNGFVVAKEKLKSRRCCRKIDESSLFFI